MHVDDAVGAREQPVRAGDRRAEPGREPDDDGRRGAVGKDAAEGDDDRLAVDAGVCALPSTVTDRRSSAPSLAITVFSSRRSMPPPDRFRALIVTLPASRRSATPRRTATSYVAVIARLVRWTEPGTMAVAAAAGGCAAGAGAPLRAGPSPRRPVRLHRSWVRRPGGDDRRRRRARSGPRPRAPRSRPRSLRRATSASGRRLETSVRILGMRAHRSLGTLGRRLVVRPVSAVASGVARSIREPARLDRRHSSLDMGNSCHRGRNDTLWPRPWSESRHLMHALLVDATGRSLVAIASRPRGPSEPSLEPIRSSTAMQARRRRPCSVSGQKRSLLAIVTRRAGPATADTGGDGRHSA